jgi:hypothetical protein
VTVGTCSARLVGLGTLSIQVFIQKRFHPRPVFVPAIPCPLAHIPPRSHPDRLREGSRVLCCVCEISTHRGDPQPCHPETRLRVEGSLRVGVRAAIYTSVGHVGGDWQELLAPSLRLLDWQHRPCNRSDATQDEVPE